MSEPTMAQYEREMEGAWDLNRQLKRRVAELEKENGWTSVDEEWPNPEKGNVLGHNGNYAFECSWDDVVQYWRPLPEPPKEQVK